MKIAEVARADEDAARRVGCRIAPAEVIGPAPSLLNMMAIHEPIEPREDERIVRWNVVAFANDAAPKFFGRDMRNAVFIVIRVHPDGDAHLADLRQALHLLRLLAGAIQRG